MRDPVQPLERRVVSILFADLVGFTSLSEGLDAEEVASVQGQYFERVRETIERYGGRVEKFIGDAAMAVFGVPRARDDDAERAVRAGLALVRAVEALAARIGLPEMTLRLRVGVNTGEVAYALAQGGEWRVSGDAVNTAARLQTAAEPGTVYVDDGTALAVAETIALDVPVELALKGKAQPVRAWRAVTPLPQRSRERAMGGLRAPLLGREADMAAIRAAMERAAAGGSEIVFVVAPPGVGKSRLIAELAAEAERGNRRRMVVLRARVTPDMGSPAPVVRQLLAALLGAAAADEDGRRRAGERLREALPGGRGTELATELERLLAGAETDGDAASGPAMPVAAVGQEREARFRAWIETLDALAGDQPQLWLVEDVHWAGGDLLALIELLDSQPSAKGRLLLATARPTLLDEAHGRQSGALPGSVLELQPLGATDARELISALVGDALPQSLAEAVVERSDGTPLFIEELLRAWISLGILVAGEDGSWSLTAEVASVAVPQTVQQIYAAQLDDLPTDARVLIRRASVAGRHVPELSLEALEVPAIEAALSTARRRGLLENSPPDAVAGPLLGYRHALLRDAGYSSLARAERARLHARLAGWYRTTAGSRADEVAAQIAGHYGAALDHASRLSPEIDEGLDVDTARALAIEWNERAARRALEGAAHEAARSLLRRALDLVADGQPIVRARLLLALGEATAYTADMQQGADLLSEAVELYRGAVETGTDVAVDHGYAAAAAALARVWIQQVRFDDALSLVNSALTALPDDGDPAVAPLLGIRSWLTATLTMDRSAMADVDRALDIALRVGDRRLELEIRDWRASALGELDEFAMEDWAVIGALAQELGDWRRAVKAMRIEAGAYVDDQHDRVWPIADRAAEIARRRGLDEDTCWIDYVRSEAGFVAGDWEGALAAGRRVLEVGRRNSYDRAVVRTLHVLLPIATARADLDLVEQAFRWHEARKDTFPDSPYARIMEAAIELHCSYAGLRPPFVPDPEPRLGSFNGEPGGPSWLAALETVLESWLAARDLAAADDAVSRMEAGVRDAPATSALGRGTTALLRAQVLVAQNAPTAEVRTSARQSLTHFRASRAPWWISKSLRLLRGIGEASASETRELADISRRLHLVDADSGGLSQFRH